MNTRCQQPFWLLSPSPSFVIYIYTHFSVLIKGSLNFQGHLFVFENDAITADFMCAHVYMHVIQAQVESEQMPSLSVEGGSLNLWNQP